MQIFPDNVSPFSLTKCQKKITLHGFLRASLEHESMMEINALLVKILCYRPFPASVKPTFLGSCLFSLHNTSHVYYAIIFSGTTSNKNKNKKKERNCFQKQDFLRQVRSGLRHRFQGGDAKGRESVRLEPAPGENPAK